MRAAIYDTALIPLTASWYRQVLGRLPEGAHLLDVGIGTGGALCRNAASLVDKNLRVTGVDIDEDYVSRARRSVSKRGIADRVDVRLESVYDHQGGPYDAVYFSASFMLLPDPVAALNHVTGLLTGSGCVYFTQTFQDRPSPFLERAKPLLKRLTTIDFGQVTYEQDFMATLEKGGVQLTAMETMGSHGARSYRLAVARPAEGVSAR